MEDYIPLVYLLGLSGLLGGIALLVWREIRRNRRLSGVINRLESRLARGKGEPEEHYELGSVYLEKQLYEQAVAQFRKSLDAAGEDVPVVCNALGFSYFSQEQFDLAIRYYKAAVDAAPDYVVAWNNLGHAYEKKNQSAAALEAYDQVLALEPNHDLALRRATFLRKCLTPSS